MPPPSDFRSARIRRRLSLCATILLLLSAAAGSSCLWVRRQPPTVQRETQLDAPKRIIYFLRGHGERTPDRILGDGGSGRLCRWIEGQNWQIVSIGGDRIGEAGGSGSLLAILDPLLPPNSQERTALREIFEEHGGRILLLLTADSHPLWEEFLHHWNVLVDGPQGEGTAVHPPDCGPVREDPVRFPSLRTLREDPNRPAGDRFTIQNLLESAGAAAAISLRSAYGTGGELVAVGGDFLDNGHFALAGNRHFFSEIAGRLLGDRPEEIGGEFQLYLTVQQLIRLAIPCLLLPLLFPAIFWLFLPSHRR